LRQSVLFCLVDAIGRMTAMFSSSRFDFDEHDGSAIDGDEIKLADSAPIVPRDDSVASLA